MTVSELTAPRATWRAWLLALAGTALLSTGCAPPARTGEADASAFQRTIVGGQAVALPLPSGYCALDDATPQESLILRALMATAGSPERLAVALPCNPEARTDAAFIAGRSLLVFWVAPRAATGEVLPQSRGRAGFLGQVEALLPQLLASGALNQRRADGSTAYDTRSAGEGRDEHAIYLRFRSEIASQSGAATLCGHTGVTTIRDIWVMVTAGRICRDGEADATGPLVRGLSRAATAANP